MPTEDKKTFSVKRRRVRFRPDPTDLALVDSRAQHPDGFKPDTVAVIVDEDPFGGCGLVMVENGSLQVGEHCLIRLGRLDPLRAEVVWRRTIDESVVRLGLRFLE